MKNNKGDRSIVFFGAKAPGWSQLLKKGKEVVVESRLHQCSWVIPEGIHKSKAEIMANLVESSDLSNEHRMIFKGRFF